MESSFWQFEKHIALSEKKHPIFNCSKTFIQFIISGVSSSKRIGLGSFVSTHNFSLYFHSKLNKIKGGNKQVRQVGVSPQKTTILKRQVVSRYPKIPDTENITVKNAPARLYTNSTQSSSITCLHYFFKAFKAFKGQPTQHYNRNFKIASKK